MDWARILAYVTGTVDQELLARNEYLAAENRIRWRDAACCGTVVISCMIGTQNTPSHSERSLRQVGLNRSRYRAYAERWVRSVKEECLSKIILFGEHSLRRTLCEYVEHYHAERNHQGRDNVLLFPRNTDIHREGAVQC